jgi:hypothetical protein
MNKDIEKFFEAAGLSVPQELTEMSQKSRGSLNIDPMLFLVKKLESLNAVTLRRDQYGLLRWEIKEHLFRLTYEKHSWFGINYSEDRNVWEIQAIYEDDNGNEYIENTMDTVKKFKLFRYTEVPII